jgi:small ligand-binding sensory domain FIST
VQNDYSIAAHWAGAFDEAGLRQWAVDLRARLASPRVDLGLVFMAPGFFPHAAHVLELFRVHGRIPLLAGCSSTSLIAGEEEIENDAGLVLGLYSLPGARLQAIRFTQEQVEEASGPAYWLSETEVQPEQTNGWLCFVDPFHVDCESWIRAGTRLMPPCLFWAAWPVETRPPGARKSI